MKNFFSIITVVVLLSFSTVSKAQQHSADIEVRLSALYLIELEIEICRNKTIVAMFTTNSNLEKFDSLKSIYKGEATERLRSLSYDGTAREKYFFRSEVERSFYLVELGANPAVQEIEKRRKVLLDLKKDQEVFEKK